MGGSTELDFFSQVPLPILLAPLILGGLYVVTMVMIFRRASERRRRVRAAREGIDPEALKPQRNGVPGGMLSLLRAAQNTPTAPKYDLPEPDIDLLTSFVNMSETNTAAPNAPILEPESAEIELVDADILPAAPAPQPRASGTFTVTPSQERSIDMNASTAANPTSDPSDAVEVMRIWRDLNDGGLIIQMGGQRYRSLEEVRNPDLLRRFKAVLSELLSLSSEAQPPLPASRRPSLDAPPPANPTTSPSGAPGSMKARLNAVSAPPPEESKPKRFLGLGGKRSTESAQPAGIADAVEEFLQFRLAADPKLAARSVHIRPSHHHGLIIEVDGHFYESVPEVVDPDVREFLMGVMKEWEARQ